MELVRCAIQNRMGAMFGAAAQCSTDQLDALALVRVGACVLHLRVPHQTMHGLSVPMMTFHIWNVKRRLLPMVVVTQRDMSAFQMISGFMRMACPYRNHWRSVLWCWLQHINSRILVCGEGFLWLVGFLASSQPLALIHVNLKDHLESFYSDVGTSELSLLTCGCVSTNLDMAFRSRSKQASALWRDLYGSLPLTAPRLGIWVLLDAMFRYTGEMQFVQACLAACPQVELAHLLGQGLTEETQDRVTAMLQRGLKLDWTMRSTVSAFFF